MTHPTPFRLPGLTAAVFTPLKEDGGLNLARIPALVDHLERDGVSGLYVLGSTGEGVSLSSRERRTVAEAYVDAAKGRLPVVIQVGHNSLAEARLLAEHAREIGADAISATPPHYFKPDSVEVLVASLAEITAGAPELPFYYYHIPGKTGVDIDLLDFLRAAGPRLPSLCGVKFSDPRVYAVPVCRQLLQERAIDVVFGTDEMLLSALVVGMQGAVGTTYNFAAPLYVRILQYLERGDLAQARREQARAAQMIDVILRTAGRPGFKALMGVIGQDCGPHRLPHRTAKREAVAAMTQALDDIGFFAWGRSSVVEGEGAS